MTEPYDNSQFDHQGRFKDACPWEVRPCSNPAGWSTVGYMRKGPKGLPWQARHHWHDRRDADLHALLLNRGLDCEHALRIVKETIELPLT